MRKIKYEQKNKRIGKKIKKRRKVDFSKIPRQEKQQTEKNQEYRKKEEYKKVAEAIKDNEALLRDTAGGKKMHTNFGPKETTQPVRTV